MAVDTEPRNAGRRIITQAEAEAIAAKARPDAPPPNRRSRIKLTRREALVYALGISSALVAATGGAALAQPDPSTDPFLSSITPDVVKQNVPGGFAYPRFKEGEFGGKFTLTKKVADYNTTQAPDLNASGKFYIVKVNQGVPVSDGTVPAGQQQGIEAIYQVCTHLGCLIPFQAAENRFICPCHGSTFERTSDYVRGPAARNLDQFPVEVGADGTIIVDTGKRLQGKGADTTKDGA
jgi:cytochrome b6-f complex iron-sulfur subunit